VLNNMLTPVTASFKFVF